MDRPRRSAQPPSWRSLHSLPDLAASPSTATSGPLWATRWRRRSTHWPARLTQAGAAHVDHEHVLRNFAFDSDRRRESVLTATSLMVKGAPDSVLPRCIGLGDDDASLAMTTLAEQGLRVLAVARRDASAVDDGDDADHAEADLQLLGLIGLHDPPRVGVGDAIAEARGAGIRLAMLTGDHPATATAIARQVGFFAWAERVLEGHDLSADQALLGELLDHDGVVISRVSPADKLRIAQACRLVDTSSR